MLFEGSLLELNVRWLLAVAGLIVFGSLTRRALRSKNDLPPEAEVWRDKWWRIPIFIGLGFSIVWIFLLLAYNV
jgi:hypothetical protein